MMRFVCLFFVAGFVICCLYLLLCCLPFWFNAALCVFVLLLVLNVLLALSVFACLSPCVNADMLCVCVCCCVGCVFVAFYIYRCCCLLLALMMCFCVFVFCWCCACVYVSRVLLFDVLF